MKGHGMDALQLALAARRTRATRAADSDWPQVVALYEAQPALATSRVMTRTPQGFAAWLIMPRPSLPGTRR